MAARIRTAGSGEVQPIAGSRPVLKFSRAAAAVPLPFPFDETRAVAGRRPRERRVDGVEEG